MIDIIKPLGAMQIDNQMHAGATDAFANRKVVLGWVLGQILGCKVLGALRGRRSRHFQFGFAVFLPGSACSGSAWVAQALHRSQEGVLSHAVLPNQGQELEMPATRSSNERGHRKRKPLDQSTRTDHQRLNPHLNAISGESSRFCNQNFNALSRSLACDVKSVTHGVTLGRGPLSRVERRRPITSRWSKRAALKIVRGRAPMRCSSGPFPGG